MRQIKIKMSRKSPLAVLYLDQGEGSVILVDLIDGNRIVAPVPNIEPLPVRMQSHLRNGAFHGAVVRDAGQALEKEEQVVWRSVGTVGTVVSNTKVLHCRLIVPGNTVGHE